MKETKKSGEVGMIPTKTLREISEEAYKICSECKITDSCEKTDCIVNVRQFVSVDVLRQKLQELLKSPFIRTDLEIEIEVKNARKNWKYYKKKGRKGFSDEDFRQILRTRRVRASEIEQLLVGLEPKEAKK